MASTDLLVTFGVYGGCRPGLRPLIVGPVRSWRGLVMAAWGLVFRLMLTLATYTSTCRTVPVLCMADLWVHEPVIWRSGCVCDGHGSYCGPVDLSFISTNTWPAIIHRSVQFKLLQLGKEGVKGLIAVQFSLKSRTLSDSIDNWSVDCGWEG